MQNDFLRTQIREILQQNSNLFQNIFNFSKEILEQIELYIEKLPKSDENGYNFFITKKEKKYYLSYNNWVAVNDEIKKIILDNYSRDLQYSGKLDDKEYNKILDVSVTKLIQQNAIFVDIIKIIPKVYYILKKTIIQNIISARETGLLKETKFMFNCGDVLLQALFDYIDNSEIFLKVLELDLKNKKNMLNLFENKKKTPKTFHITSDVFLLTQKYYKKFNPEIISLLILLGTIKLINKYVVNRKRILTMPWLLRAINCEKPYEMDDFDYVTTLNTLLLNMKNIYIKKLGYLVCDAVAQLYTKEQLFVDNKTQKYLRFYPNVFSQIINKDLPDVILTTENHKITIQKDNIKKSHQFSKIHTKEFFFGEKDSMTFEESVKPFTLNLNFISNFLTDFFLLLQDIKKNKILTEYQLQFFSETFDINLEPLKNIECLKEIYNYLLHFAVDFDTLTKPNYKITSENKQYSVILKKITNKLYQQKFFICEILTKEYLLIQFDLFYFRLYFDSRGRAYPIAFFNYLQPLARLFLSFHRKPEPEKANQTIEDLLEKQLECKLKKKPPKELDNNITLEYIFYNETKKNIFDCFCLYSDLFTSKQKKIVNYTHYYNLDAVSSGLQLLSMSLKSYKLGTLCGLTKDNTDVDIYTKCSITLKTHVLFLHELFFTVKNQENTLYYLYTQLIKILISKITNLDEITIYLNLCLQETKNNNTIFTQIKENKFNFTYFSLKDQKALKKKLNLPTNLIEDFDKHLSLISLLYQATLFSKITLLSNFINRSFIKTSLMSLLYGAKIQSHVKHMLISFQQQTLENNIVLTNQQIRDVTPCLNLLGTWIVKFVKTNIPEALIINNLIGLMCNKKMFNPPIFSNKKHFLFFFYPLVGNEKYTKSILNKDFTLIKYKSLLDFKALKRSLLPNYIQYLDSALLRDILYFCNLSNISVFTIHDCLYCYPSDADKLNACISKGYHHFYEQHDIRLDFDNNDLLIQQLNAYIINNNIIPLYYTDLDTKNCTKH